MQRRLTLSAFLFCWILSFVLGASSSRADVPLSGDDIIAPSASKLVISTLGILTNHRPYQGAIPLGNPGIDIGLEATLVHLPTDFGQAMQEGGMGDASSFSGGSLPDLKVHFHKGLGPSADLGLSGLWYMGNRIWGGHLKFNLNHPEEGLTVAFRIGYSSTNLDLSRLGFKGVTIKDTATGIEIGNANMRLMTTTYTPALVASTRMDFAEPYIGLQVEMTSGHLELPVTFTALPLPDQTLTTSDTGATELSLFTGVSFRMPNAGLRLALEGGYGSLGMHTLGLWAGFGF